MERRRQPEPAFSLEIDYKRDRNHVWIPSGWRQRLANQKDAGTLDATVTRTTINEALPADTFVRPGAADAQICDVTIDEETSRRLAAEMAKPSTVAGASMEAIVAAWAKRQAKMRSFHLAWQCDWTAIYRPGTNPPPRREVQPEFQHFRSKSAEWIDGDRIAFEQILIEEPKQSPVVRVVKCAFDGRKSRTFFAGDAWKVGAGQVVRGFDDALPDRAALELLTLAMRRWRRGSRASIPRNAGSCQTWVKGTARHARSSARRCHLTRPPFIGSTRPAIMSWSGNIGHPRAATSREWISRIAPTRLMVGFPPDAHGRLSERTARFQDLTVIKINQCEINSLIPASTFEIEFPKGTEADELADSPPRPQPAQAPPPNGPAWERAAATAAPPAGRKGTLIDVPTGTLPVRTFRRPALIRSAIDGPQCADYSACASGAA